MNNEFTDVPGYEGLYIADKNGRIFKLMQQGTHGKGYKVISLTNDKGQSEQQLVHRVIAKTFLSNPSNKPHINHRNGKKDDNRVDNLEWATASENRQHAFDIGLQKVAKGKYNHNYGKRGELCACSKIILDTQSGIFYFGVKDAAISRNLKPANLYGKLTGNIKNDTPLIYV